VGPDLELHLQTFTVLLTAAIFAIRKRTATINVTFTPSGRSYNSNRRLECELIAETRYCSEVGPAAWFPRTKRLGNVFVGAHLQQRDFVVKVTGSGENNNGDRGLRGFHL
jgi:hypothetical protein